MMKRTLQWRKILNTLAIGLALLLLGMIFGGILKYGWDKETMRITVTTDEKKVDSKNTTGGAILETGTEASGKSSIAVVRPGADPRTAKHVFIITAY